MSDDSLSARIEALEVKVAYQEVTIEELNKVVVSLRATIDRLGPQMKELAERVKPLLDQAVTPGGEKPPHY